MSAKIGISAVSPLATIAALFVLAATASCGSPKPGGQTVAVVDGKPITEAELNADMAGDPAKRTQEMRNAALQALINRKVLVAAAREKGLDKDPSIRLQLAQQEEIFLAKRFLQQGAQGIGQSVSESDINRYLAENPQVGAGRKILEVEQIQFSMPTDKTVLAEMERTKTLPDLTQVLQRHGVRVQPSKVNLDTANLPLEMYKGLMGTQSGEPLVLASGASTLGQVMVGAVDAPLPGDKAQEIARRAVEQDRASGRLMQQIQALRSSAKVDYAKGFSAPKGEIPAVK